MVMELMFAVKAGGVIGAGHAAGVAVGALVASMATAGATAGTVAAVGGTCYAGYKLAMAAQQCSNHALSFLVRVNYTSCTGVKVKRSYLVQKGKGERLQIVKVENESLVIHKALGDEWTVTIGGFDTLPCADVRSSRFIDMLGESGLVTPAANVCARMTLRQFMCVLASMDTGDGTGVVAELDDNGLLMIHAPHRLCGAALKGTYRVRYFDDIEPLMKCTYDIA